MSAAANLVGPSGERRGARLRALVRVGLATLAALALHGCTRPPIDVREPTTARPEAPPASAPSTGAIFRDASYRPLFEDRRARHVGDILTIQLNEKLNAERKSSSNASRTGKITAAVPTVQGLPFAGSIQGAAIDANSSNTFEGKGETSGSNLLTGTIAVTVVEVLPNGNLVVTGEKQIGINQNAEIIRFSGVVNPATILPGNTVSSAQVADARIDYQGKGYIDEAQIMGFLARFFLTFLPF